MLSAKSLLFIYTKANEGGAPPLSTSEMLMPRVIKCQALFYANHVMAYLRCSIAIYDVTVALIDAKCLRQNDSKPDVIDSNVATNT